MRNHKLIRLYCKQSLEIAGVVQFDKEKSHYISSVMRLKVADEIIIFDGRNGEFKASIIDASKNSVTAKLILQTKQFQTSPDVTLCYAPLKNVKNEFVIQKATELGVSKIQPIITQYTIKKSSNFERYNLIAEEAAEQCERLDVPEIKEIINFEKFLLEYKNYNIFFCDESGQGTPAKSLLTTNYQLSTNKWCILIGPEGGFSPQEILQIYKLPNTLGVGMGERILRADTAIISALAIWQAIFGDFNKLPEFKR